MKWAWVFVILLVSVMMVNATPDDNADTRDSITVSAGIEIEGEEEIVLLQKCIVLQCTYPPIEKISVEKQETNARLFVTSRTLKKHGQHIGTVSIHNFDVNSIDIKINRKLNVFYSESIQETDIDIKIETLGSVCTENGSEYVNEFAYETQNIANASEFYLAESALGYIIRVWGLEPERTHWDVKYFGPVNFENRDEILVTKRGVYYHDQLIPEYNIKNPCEIPTEANDEKSDGQRSNQVISTSADICDSMIIRSKNGYNIVFVGDYYENSKQLKEDVLKLIDTNGNNGYHGLFSINLLRENQDKFNFYALNQGTKLPRYTGKREDFRESPETASEAIVKEACRDKILQPDLIVFVSKKDFRSFAYPRRGVIYLSVPNGLRKANILNHIWLFRALRDLPGRVFIHEFGHAFGQLDDEYYNFDEDRTANTWAPNCVANEELAQESWGEFINLEHIGFYKGCGGDAMKEGGDFIRPTKNSIMRDHFKLGDGFYEVNEKYLQKQLKVWS